MAKTIDWESMYKAPMRGKRGGYASRKEQVEKSYADLAKQQRAQAQFSQLEPLLKQSLLEHMVSRTPIEVLAPITYFTEGLVKSEGSNPTSMGRFEVIRKTVEPGEKLTFVRTDNTMGQWLFKSSSGEEVEIYNRPTIDLNGRDVIQNPGFWGLLTNTHIYRDVLEAAESSQTP